MNVKAVQIVGSILIGGLVLSTMLMSTKTKAGNSTPTGQCGALMDITPKNIGPVAASTSYGSSALMYIDFTNLTITARATVANFPANYVTPSVSSKFPTYTTNTVTTSFTLAAGPVPNTYVLTPASGIPTFAVISVNTGNTFLLQAENDRGSGVCQMI